MFLMLNSCRFLREILKCVHEYDANRFFDWDLDKYVLTRFRCDRVRNGETLAQFLTRLVGQTMAALRIMGCPFKPCTYPHSHWS